MKRLRMPVIVTCWLILCNIFNIVYLYTEQIQQGSYMGGLIYLWLKWVCH